MAQIRFFLTPEDVRELEAELKVKYDVVFLAVAENPTPTGILETSLFQWKGGDAAGGWAARAGLTRADYVPKLRKWPAPGGVYFGVGTVFGIDWDVGTLIDNKLHEGRVYYWCNLRDFDLWAKRVFAYLRNVFRPDRRSSTG